MKRNLAVFFVWAAALAAPLAAQSAESMLVSSEWLSRHLNDNDVVVLHVGSPKDYESGHIPGARLITLQDISVTGPRSLRLELPPPEVLGETFGKFGVSDKSRVVVYPGADAVQSATRVWFTLDHLGLGDRTSLLDGGLTVWRAEGRPISTEAPKPRTASFTVRPRPELLVDAEWILTRVKDSTVQIVDARAPEFYTGEKPGITWKPGRIPGARNVPFSSLLDEQRKLKPAASLRSMLQADGTAKTTVTYCHLGQQATLVYFVARYLGMQPRLYDGSFQDWSTRLGLPVESGPAAAAR